MKREIKVGSEVVINGTWYIVAENLNCGAWVTVIDQDGGEKEFLRSDVATIINSK